MNVLYIIGGKGERYGSEIIAMDLILSGKKNGIKYTIVTAKKGVVYDFCKKHGVKCYVVPFKFFVYKAMSNKIFDCVKKAAWRIRAEVLTKWALRYVERNVDMRSIDVIHTNLSRDLMGGMLAVKYHIPHVWHLQELVDAHYKLSFLRKNQLEWMIKHSNRFVAISDTVANDWIRKGIPREKVVTVHNGIDLNRYKNVNNYEKRDVLRMIMVGHLVPAKGQEKVLRMLGKLPSDIRKRVSVDFYGDGTEAYKEVLRTTAKSAEIDANLKGYCNDISMVLGEYDIGLNCSCGEGFGLTTVEYMAAGLCTVAANTGANEEIIKNGINGYIFDYNSETDLVNVIRQIIENPDKTNSIAQRAREDAFSLYSLEGMQQGILDIYKEMCQERKNERNRSRRIKKNSN